MERAWVALRPGRGVLIVFAMATLLALFTRTFVVQAFRIPSDSMAPALIAGDHVLVNKFIYAAARGSGAATRLLPARDVRRGDVVVFRSPPGAIVIKRCLGLPGETVDAAARRLRIDGVRVDESGYLGAVRADPEPPSFAPLKIPDRHYFCLGDHRSRSRDSRSWGPVSDRELKGRAVVIYWSIRSAKGSDEDPSSWDKMPSRWWSRIRWERSFKLVR